MADIQRVDDERSASTLADLLKSGSRRRPVAVVTISAGQMKPWVDVERVAHEAGDLAEVFLMPTGTPSWALAHRLTDGAQVYGGAGRIYPAGREWLTNPAKAPLHFAFNQADGERATHQLISDLFRAITTAGIPQPTRASTLRSVTGGVKATIAGRALVMIGNPFPAAVAEELTVPDVSIERLFTVGQQVAGAYDAQTNRLDVRASLRPAEEALSYTIGEVVLAKVAMVRRNKAELTLYPQTSTPPVKVAVLQSDVTTNPLDDLRTLMTVGEVVAARVTATAPWTLVLNDVDDDEPIVAAPSVLPDGPPWLIEENEASGAEPPAEPSLAPMPVPDPEPELSLAAEPSAPARPTPAMFDKTRARPSAPPPPPAPNPPPAPSPPTESTKALLLQIDGLKAEVNTLHKEPEELRAQLRAHADEHRQLRDLLDQAERRANHAENDLKAARARLRKTRNVKPAAESAERPQFADPEQGFRYLVLTRWATRTLPSEQRDRPLRDYRIGPQFLTSLDRLEGIKIEKVADVVFEIVTGLAPQIASREVHRLRSGSGGEDAVRVRDDGAVGWRASLQVGTPSARRIHYWALPNGQIELARVATHDDFDA